MVNTELVNSNVMNDWIVLKLLCLAKQHEVKKIQKQKRVYPIHHRCLHGTNCIELGRYQA